MVVVEGVVRWNVFCGEGCSVAGVGGGGGVLDGSIGCYRLLEWWTVHLGAQLTPQLNNNLAAGRKILRSC